MNSGPLTPKVIGTHNDLQKSTFLEDHISAFRGAAPQIFTCTRKWPMLANTHDIRDGGPQQFFNHVNTKIDPKFRAFWLITLRPASSNNYISQLIITLQWLRLLVVDMKSTQHVTHQPSTTPNIASYPKANICQYEITVITVALVLRQPLLTVSYICCSTNAYIEINRHKNW